MRLYCFFKCTTTNNTERITSERQGKHDNKVTTHQTQIRKKGTRNGQQKRRNRVAKTNNSRKQNDIHQQGGEQK